MFEFKLPDLGEGIHEGELLTWHVAVGDEVIEDDPLCEVETDKAAVTIPSPRTGRIVSLHGSAGETLNVGDVLVVIDDSGGAGGEMRPGGDDGELSESRVPGERGKGVGRADAAVPPEPNPAGAGNGSGQAAPDAACGPVARVAAAPATRRLAREMGIDISRVRGTGPGGRILPSDLEAFEGQGESSPDPVPDRRPAEQAAGNGAPSPESGSSDRIPFLEFPVMPETFDGPVERIPIRSLRKKTAVRTTSAAILMPHVAHMDEIDVTDLEALRKTYNSGREGRLTLLSFVIKAAAAALKEFPMFNAGVDVKRNEIIHKKFFNIGFAADTPRGLMVPVIRDADRQSLAGVGYRIRHLAEKARDGKIELSDLTGGTFTITNVGALGGTHVFPIINGSESAILGMGRVEKKPRVVKDEICIRKVLPVTLCFDHRVADGAQAAVFVLALKAMLEDHLELMTRI